MVIERHHHQYGTGYRSESHPHPVEMLREKIKDNTNIARNPECMYAWFRYALITSVKEKAGI
ncbi:MAG: hypothetical protein GX550_07215 [Syntrophomonadaceae bacterium]|nr:hypothetical protein [Syntrophomonadaceae bacterium]